MSRIQLNIDRIVLNGFEPLDAKSLVGALRSQLTKVLSDPASRADWARSHRTPVLRLGRMALEPGAGGAGKFGRQIGKAVGRGLKP
jgi:hypothetical protein